MGNIRNVNRLSQQQFFKACNYIASNAERLLKDTPSEKMLAEELTKALGFGVAHGSIAAMKDATGVKWAYKGRFHGKHYRNAKSMTGLLRNAVVQLQSELDIAIATIKKLQSELGLTKDIRVTSVDWVDVSWKEDKKE